MNGLQELLANPPALSAAWGFLIPAILGGLGAIGANKSRNREAQNNANLVGNQEALQQWQTMQQALMNALIGGSRENIDNARIDLDRRNFSLQAPNVRGQQALVGSLLQNLQPVKLSGLNPQIASRMPQITGGLNPSAIGPLARQMGLLMQQNAVSGQQKGDQFDPLVKTDFLKGLIPAPKLAGYQGPGKAESILGILGAAGGAWSGLQNQHMLQNLINGTSGNSQYYGDFFSAFGGKR